jgi:hypothetical protein
MRFLILKERHYSYANKRDFLMTIKRVEYSIRYL